MIFARSSSNCSAMLSTNDVAEIIELNDGHFMS